MSSIEDYVALKLDLVDQARAQHEQLRRKFQETRTMKQKEREKRLKEKKEREEREGKVEEDDIEDEEEDEETGIADPDFVFLYQSGQWKIASGDYAGAVDDLMEAFHDAREYKNSLVWKRMFCSIGGALAGALDFLGRDEAGPVLEEILAVEPDGFHIGDYAVYLHRRRKDFDKANE